MKKIEKETLNIEVENWEKELNNYKKKSTLWDEKKKKFLIKHHKDYTQVVLAKILGISRSYLSDKIMELKANGEL